MSSPSEIEKKKRQRGANFTQREINLLLGLINQYKHIVENKKTDSIINEQKNAAWKTITEKFNAVCPEFMNRSTESLKKLYDNKKKEARKQKAEERKECLLTGGGLPPVMEKDDTQELILSLMDPLTVSGGQNEFDSDSVSIIVPKQIETIESVFEINSQVCYQIFYLKVIYNIFDTLCILHNVLGSE